MITGILLSGKKFAGKDHVYEHIRRVVRDRPVRKHKWATPLRLDLIRMLAAIGIHVTMDELEDQQAKAPFVALMQWYGPFMRKLKGEDYWVRRGLATVEDDLRFADRQHETPSLFVNTDTRYPNEITLPKGQGWISIRLEVSREKQIERAERLGIDVPEIILAHSSETALDGFEEFDYVVDSDNDLETVYQVIDGILEKEEIRLRRLDDTRRAA